MVSWREISARADKAFVDQIEDIFTEYDAHAVTVSAAESTEEIFDQLDNEFRLWRHVKVVGLFAGDQDVSPILLALGAGGVARQNIEISEVEDQDWVSRWQQQQKPLDFGHGLTICPPSLAATVSTSRKILLEPGMAFGTGTHPTTKMCLQWIAARDWAQGETALDFGCGSGVLAMAMAKCGAHKVWGSDIDPQALLVAQDNIDNNALDNIELSLNKDLRLSQADVVVANILLEPLIAEKPLIDLCIAAGGQLVMTGILTEQAGALINAFSPEYELEVICTDQEWALVAGHQCG